MKGFQGEEKGLFTFYREQAEFEEQQKAEQLQIARLKKIKKGEGRRFSQQPNAPIKKNYDQLAHSSTIPHIKEDESVFRSKSELNSVKSRQKKQRKSVSKQKCEESSLKRSYNSVSMAEVARKRSLDLFLNKKNLVSGKYLNPEQINLLAPKQFEAAAMLNLDSFAGIKKSGKGGYSLKRKLLQIKNKQQKLPRISPMMTPQPQEDYMFPRKKSKDGHIYYNHRDIIENNHKFNLNLEHERSMKKLQHSETLSVLELIKSIQIKR